MTESETAVAEAVTVVHGDVDAAQAQQWFSLISSAWAECSGDWQAFREILTDKVQQTPFQRACETFLHHLDNNVTDPASLLEYLHQNENQLPDWYAALLSTSSQTSSSVDVFDWVDPHQERLLLAWSQNWRAELAAYFERGWGADWANAFRDEDKHAWLSGWLSAVHPAPSPAENQATTAAEYVSEQALEAVAAELLDGLSAAIPSLAAGLGMTQAELVAVLDQMNLKDIAEAAVVPDPH